MRWADLLHEKDNEGAHRDKGAEPRHGSLIRGA
jgi:hypothetical protein